MEGRLLQDPREPAGRWFEVVVEAEQISWLATVRQFLISLFAYCLPLGFWWAPDGEVKQRTNVLLVRRRDQAAVAVYEYSRFSEALVHRTALERRLATQTLFDFSRELGLPLVTDAPLPSGGPSVGRGGIRYISRREIVARRRTHPVHG